jgi:hypothetical protein
MATTWNVVFTVLPNSVPAAQPNPNNALMLRVSVLCTPKLLPGNSIQGTPLDNWVSWVQKLRMELRFDGLAVQAPVTFDEPLAQLDSRMWDAVFDGIGGSKATPVGSGRAGMPVKTQTYSVDTVAGGIHDTFQKALQGAVGRGVATATDVLALYANSSLFKTATTPPEWLEPASAALSSEAARLIHFHGALSNTTNALSSLAKAAPSSPPDFNEVISMIGSHQVLQKKLGLVLTGTVTIPTAGMVSQGRVAAIPTIPGVDATGFVLPATAYELRMVGNRRVFLPRPRDAAKSRLTFRLVDLSPPTTALRDANEPLAYRSQSIDVESAVEQMQSHRDAATRVTGVDRRLPVPDLTQPPRLRTGGTSLYAACGRAGAFTDAVNNGDTRQRALNSAMSIARGATVALATDDVFLEDVVRGYRVDVRVNCGSWSSLCARRTEFEFPKFRAGSFSHDDEGIVSAAASAPTEGAANIFNVHESLFSWSGWSLTAPRPERDDEAIQCSAAGFRTRVLQRGPLPPRRLGHTHEFRLRVVDVAGESWTVEEANDLESSITNARLASEPNRLLRAESVQPPVVLMIPSGSPDPKPATALILRSVSVGDTWDALPMADVYVVPPRMTVSDAETHGMLDHMRDHEGWQRIGELEDGIRNGDGPEFLRNRRIPYIPDIFCSKAWLGVIRAPGPPVGLQFGRADSAEWPKWQAFRLTVRSAKDALRATVSGSEITLDLPPGNVTAMLVIAAVDDARQLDLLLMRHWAVEAASVGVSSTNDEVLHTEAAIDAAIAAGTLPLVAPPAVIELTHAVSKPIFDPAWGLPPGDVVASRGINSNSKESFLPVTLNVHGQSTGSVTLLASWTDVRDSGDGVTHARGEARPIRLDVRVQDQSQPPSTSSRDRRIPLQQEAHVWPDTKYRRVTYTPIATSRFSEHFGDQPDSTSPGYFDRTGPPIEVIVPNAAVPPVLSPRFAIPSYPEPRWGGSVLNRQQRRPGGGLSLFFDAPFHDATGDGEQVGVVIWTGNQTALTPLIAQFVSRWGRDPFWAVDRTSPASRDGARAERSELSPWQFNSQLIAQAVPAPLVELLGAQGADAAAAAFVKLIPLDVAWDHDEGFWRCDLDIDSGDLYFPHVQLALVRYQRNSIAGAAVSNVVNSMFAQLLPDRTVTIRRGWLNPRDLNVEVRGPYPAAGSAGTIGIEARLQTSTAPVPSELDWQDSVDVPSVKLHPGVVQNGVTSWTGTVNGWPESAPQRRLLIRETETLNGGEVRSRIVYAADYFLHD